MIHEALIDLLKSMTLEEKAGQLAQVPISTCIGGISQPTGPMEAYSLTPEMLKYCGSLICDSPGDAENTASAIRSVMEAHPHHIPPVVMKDIIHGCQTVFPIPLAIGSSFDEKHAQQMGRCGAIEGAARGMHVTFAPMVDVVRDPRWGRVMESPGEAPALCAAMGAAMVRGTHGEGIDKKDGLAACAKHFVGYGLSQAGQEYAPIDVSRTELYNTYLLPFQAAVDAGAELIMPAFVSIDRVPCVCNEWLLQDILRDRMGFRGVTISDWGDAGQLMNHGVAADLEEASQLSLDAGLDMDMMSFAYLRHLPQLVREGKVSEKKLDDACLRVLELKNRLGLFEDPFKNTSREKQNQICGSADIRKAAYDAAVNSCVLLKNDGTLPLRTGAKVALVGPHANTRDILGGWSLDASPSTETLLERFTKDSRIELTDPEHADVILYAVGERQQDTGEDTSKTRIELTKEQIGQLHRLHSLEKPVVMLLFCGRPLILTDVLPYCNAVLNVWFPGSEGAAAILALVMGDETPSGHLSMTFPRALGQVPIHHDLLSTARPFKPDTAFINRYIDEVNDPLFPFGYGLSYTTFDIGEPVVISEHAISASPAVVAVRVGNTGDRDGAIVLQVYARLRHSRLIRPDKKLIAWKKCMLKPGESKTVSFSITPAMLLMYDAAGRAVEAEGICDLAFGTCSDAAFNAQIIF